MAHKPESYRVDEKKKIIILYTNVEPTSIEKMMIERYLNLGYTERFEVKKPSTTIEQMRADFGDDKAALAEFERLYHLKQDEITEVSKTGKKKTGFHLAAKYHADFVKANKKKKK